MNTDPAEPPVVLLHGLATSADRTWRETGWIDILGDTGRRVVAPPLPGHDGPDAPTEPDAYVGFEAQVAALLPEGPIDAVGFSLGAMTLLRIAIDQPHRFRKLVLAGIGTNLFDDDTTGTQRIIDALEGNAPPDDNIARLFAQYGHQPDNDVVALTAVMKRPRGVAFSAELIRRATCETLVVIGDKDFAGPGDPLVAALPNARLVTLRNVDHFATPESFGFIDAMLEFLDAIPA